MEICLQALLLAAGFILLVKGAGLFVDGASGLAEKLKIPQLIIGLTVVAMGTSMPEAAVSISAAVKGNADITIGNILGSNILNILIILGLSATVAPLVVKASTIRYELPFLICTTIILFIQGLDGAVTPADGILQLLLFIAYLAFLLLATVKRPSVPEPALSAKDCGGSVVTSGHSPSSLKQSPWRLLLFTAAGLVMIIAGSSMAVESASAIARILGISERFIGLTIIALGTSLPELFTSVTAARKGKADIAVGNIVGSNIFNLLFVIGAAALVSPVPYAASFRFDHIISGTAALFLLGCCVKNQRLSRRHGIFMLFGYAAYFIYLL